MTNENIPFIIQITDYAIRTIVLPIGSYNEQLVYSAVISIEMKIIISEFYSYAAFHVEYLTIFSSDPVTS